MLASPNPEPLRKNSRMEVSRGRVGVTVPGHMCVLMKDMQERTDLFG